MNPKAQASLEYLMTYGWALILIATIVAVLVFVVGTPVQASSFFSSDPTRFLVAGSRYDASTGEVEIVLQNITGGDITVTAIGGVGYSNCKLNDILSPEAQNLALKAGAKMKIKCDAKGSSKGLVLMKYTDFAGFKRRVSVSGKDESGSVPGGETGGLVAYYKFDEGIGTIITDSVGENKGTIIAPSWLAPASCASGSCLSSPTISITNAENMFSNEWSVTGWVKITGPSILLNFDAGGDSLPRVAPSHSAGNPKPLLYENGEYYRYGATNITGTGWHHIAFVFRNSDKYLHVFVDGVDRSGTLSTSVPNVSPVTSIWKIGSPFSGTVDDLKVFNRSLSPSEICAECKANATPLSVICSCT